MGIVRTDTLCGMVLKRSRLVVCSVRSMTGAVADLRASVLVRSLARTARAAQLSRTFDSMSPCSLCGGLLLDSVCCGV